MCGRVCGRYDGERGGAGATGGATWVLCSTAVDYIDIGGQGGAIFFDRGGASSVDKSVDFFGGV